MKRKTRITIVEDDETIRDELSTYLTNVNYEVITISDFTDIVNDVLDLNPDLLLLDVNLPGMSGLNICDKLRKVSQMPIIFVTGNTTSMDELDCISRGGDDYITKPYQIPILMARITSVLRRTMGHKETNSNKIEYRGVTLNLAAAQIEKENIIRELTRNELKILYCLFQSSGEIISRADIIDYLWDNEVFIDDNTLSVNITRIRGKLNEIGASNFIETKRGLGYRI